MRVESPLMDRQKRAGSSRFQIVWPLLGAVSVLLVIIVLVRWLANGVVSVSPGHDVMPAGKALVMHVLEWGQFVVFLLIVGCVVIRPALRKQGFGFDALFVLATIVVNFWDVLDNYWGFNFQYNALHFNVGSWAGFIPGWHSPSPALWAVPVGFVFGAYTWAFYLAVVAGCRILAYLRDRFQSWSAARGLVVVFLFNAAISGIAENIYLRVGAIANIRPYEPLTLWDGSPLAWPLYNPVLFGLTWTALTALRWSRDGNGRSFVEGAIPSFVSSPTMQTTARFFAIFAFLEVTYILLYFVPFSAFAAMRTAPPNVFPSYFPVP
jgi:hypothetical protein